MSRIPLKNEPPLLDADRTIRLVEEVDAFLNWPISERQLYGRRQWSRLRRALAIDALHVALEVAIDTGDPRVLAAVLDAADVAGIDDPYQEGPEQAFASAARELIGGVKAINNSVRDCARSKSVAMRAATAAGLGPRAQRALGGEGDEVDAEASKIVLALAKDADAHVRTKAREALGGAAPPAWAAFYPSNPLAGLPAEEATRLHPPLAQAAAAMEMPDPNQASAALAAAIADLPDDLAVPILEAWVRLEHPGTARARVLLDRWAGAPGGGDRVIAWLTGTTGLDTYALGGAIGHAVRRLPQGEAVAICVRLADCVLSLDDDADVSSDDAARILEAAFPHGADPTPLLDVALSDRRGADLEPGVSADAPGRLAIGMVALGPRAAFAPIVDRLVEAAVRGFPGAWAVLRDQVTRRLRDVEHPALRARAERALIDGDADAIGEALVYLTHGGHDPERDPSVASILRAAAKDPRLAAAMVGHYELKTSARDPLRARLAAGALPPAQAVELARTLSHRSEHPSLTATEWDVVRGARAQLTTPDELSSAAWLLPPFEDWTPEDRAFVESLLARHGGDSGVASALAHTFARCASADLIPLAERLLAASSGHTRSIVKRALQVCRGERRTLWQMA